MADFQIWIVYQDKCSAHAYLLFYPCFVCQNLKGWSDCSALTMGFCKMGLAQMEILRNRIDSFFRMQIQNRDNTLFWLQISVAALKNIWQYSSCVAKEDYVCWEQIKPRPGIEPGTFQIFGLTLSQMSYRGLSSIARMPLNSALSNNVNNWMFSVGSVAFLPSTLSRPWQASMSMSFAFSVWRSPNLCRPLNNDPHTQLPWFPFAKKLKGR